MELIVHNTSQKKSAKSSCSLSSLDEFFDRESQSDRIFDTIAQELLQKAKNTSNMYKSIDLHAQASAYMQAKERRENNGRLTTNPLSAQFYANLEMKK